MEQTKIKETGIIVDLKFNQGKAKYMYILQNDSNDLNLEVDSYGFENVSSFKYLRININN